jgi:hypothetical protein
MSLAWQMAILLTDSVSLSMVYVWRYFLNSKCFCRAINFISSYDTACNTACGIAHGIICTVRLFGGKMHSDWFNGIEILQGRWQNGEKKWDTVIPADLKRLFWHVYVLVPAYFVWPCVPHVTYVTSHRGHWPLLIRVSGITWRGSKLLEASRNVILHTRYVSTYFYRNSISWKAKEGRIR